MTHVVSNAKAKPIRATQRMLDAIADHADRRYMDRTIPPQTAQTRPESAAVEAMLQSIVASAEPAVAFTSLAATTVPAFADECRIAIVDEQQAAFRIHYPREPGPVVPAGQVVVTRVSAAACGGEPAYWGTVTFEWHDGADVRDLDLLTARRLTDGVAALVRHERLVAADHDDNAKVAEPAGTP